MSKLSTSKRIWWPTAAALAAVTIAVIVLIQESTPAQASAPLGAPPPCRCPWPP